MTYERMKKLLKNCLYYIQRDNNDVKAHVHDLCGFKDNELKELGFYYLTNGEED